MTVVLSILDSQIITGYFNSLLVTQVRKRRYTYNRKAHNMRLYLYHLIIAVSVVDVME